MASWTKLPAELRLMILEKVLHHPIPETWYRPNVRAKMASYASVSREWQYFFERHSFRTLSLRSEDMHFFSHAVKNENVVRLSYIRILSFQIDLDTYDCTECHEDEDEATIYRNNAYFTIGIHNLLSILSRWKPSNDVSRERNSGLQLDLGVYCHSDSYHKIRAIRRKQRFYFSISTVGPLCRQYTSKSGTLAKTVRLGMRDEFYFNSTPPEAAAQRVFGARPLTLNSDLGLEPTSKKTTVRVLPKVEIVRALRIRRKFYRLIHPSVMATLLEKSFTELRFLHIAQWRPIDKENLNCIETGYRRILANGLPKSLEQLQIYHECNGYIHNEKSALTNQRPCPELGQKLAEVSTRLRRVAVSFFADADAFFQPPPPSSTARTQPLYWPHLTCLALTSPTLRPTSCPRQIQQLLAAACEAAMRMPVLHTMEIWYADLEHACAFRFTTEPPVLSLCATWELDGVLTSSLVKAWQALAALRSVQPMLVRTKLWQLSYNVNPIYYALKHLHLGCIVSNDDIFEVRKRRQDRPRRSFLGNVTVRV